MLQDIKKASKHSAVYAIGNIANKLIGLILLPIYTNTKYFTQAEFGSLAILEATSQVMMGIMAFALTTSLNRWYWDKRYIEKQNNLFFTTLATLLLINTPILFVLIPNAHFLSNLIFDTQNYTYLLKLTFITAAIRLINSHTTNTIKLQSKSILYTGIQISQFLATMILTIIAVIKLNRGLEGIWEATIIGECFTLLLLFPFILKNLSFHFEWKILKEMFAYGFPLMFSTLTIIILNITDRYMLNFQSSLEATGVYSLALRFANILKFVIITSISTAVSPLLMKKMDSENNQRFYSKLMTYEAFIYIIAILGISFFSLEAVKLITKNQDLWEAAMIIPILSFNIATARIASLCTIGLQIKKRTKVMSIIPIISMLLNLALNYTLIPLWDIYGAAVATLSTQLFSIYVYNRTTQKYYQIDYEYRKILLLVIFAIPYILVSLYLSKYTLFIRLILKTLLLISFPFVLYLFNFYEKIEIENIKKIFYCWRNPQKIKENFNRLLQS